MLAAAGATARRPRVQPESFARVIRRALRGRRDVLGSFEAGPEVVLESR